MALEQHAVKMGRPPNGSQPVSLYDVVFESRDQRMGTHRGKTHSSSHPLAHLSRTASRPGAA